MSRTPRLIVFAPSHYGERARWALDHAGVAYREERWAPGPHAILARRMGLGSTTTPILDLGTGEVVQGSDRILDRTGLGGGDPELEWRFERRVGPLIRQLLYAGLLGNPASGVREALLDGVSGRQALVARALWPATRRIMRRGLQARSELLPALLARMAEELAWFDGVLRARGDRLAGDAFGRADLTAASLLAPLARPPHSPAYALYGKVAYPAAVEEALSRWGEERSLQWVRSVYASHRHPRP